MCNTAAVVVDRVLPDIPVRQWVLSTPFEMRLLLARDAEAFGELTRIFMEEVLARYRRKAAKLGLANTQGGALVFQHRFGGSLNLNTHLHAAVADGVFERNTAADGAQRATFYSVPSPEPVELIAVAYNVYCRFAARLRKKGLPRLADADESYDKENSLAACLRGCLGIGKVVQVTDDGDITFAEQDRDAKRFELQRSPHVGEFGGFSIHAGVTVSAQDREGRERLLRYCARPALSMERISETREGLIAYRLRPVQKGRATHRVMTPVEFLARIAAIIPPPRHPLLRYFGVFGPNSSWRVLCVPRTIDEAQLPTMVPNAPEPQASATTRLVDTTSAPSPITSGNRGTSVTEKTTHQSDSTASATDASTDLCPNARNRWRLDWATLLKRTYDFDVLSCPCGGRLKAVELVIEQERATLLLEQFGLPIKPPPVARARSPDWDRQEI
jgi:Putative transposase